MARRIPDQEYYFESFGSIQKPHIFHITYGEQFENSLNFHCKVGHKFVCYRVRNVNSKTLNLECACHQNSLKRKGRKKTFGCHAKAKVAVLEDIIKLSDTPRKNGAKVRKKYELDFKSEKILLLESYQILEHDSENHKLLCQKSYFQGLKRDFRHAHVQKGLKIRKCAYLETIREWGLRNEYGIDFESEIVGNQKRESNAFYQIFGRKFNKVSQDQIPPEFLFIERTDFSNKKFLIKKQAWYQYKSDKNVIFFS